MHRTKRTLSVILVMLMLLTQGLVISFGAGDDPEEPAAFSVTAETNRLHKKETLQLSCDAEQKVTWSSSDTNVAEVDDNGLVTGIDIGHAHIKATDPETGASAEFKVYVIRKDLPWRKLLEKMPVLGYRYSYEDDYYYTDDINCWQKFFGFNFAYDSIAPLILFEYDYTRVFFNYGGKDWMIQMWKGQYGAVFYGSEVGVYTKPEGRESANRRAHYAAASEEDFLNIGTSLYRENTSTGEFDLEFEVPYASHWWATGFVPGHLRDTTPCDELRAVTHITLKDEEMANLFTDGLLECGFTEVSRAELIGNDSFYQNGSDVYLQWQNISQAVNSHVVQATFWSIVGINGLMIGSFIVLLVLVFGGIGAMGLLLLFLI